MTGVIIALVSIPISMGYAQVSGLPAIYGLYGSIFPILIFGLFSTSPQFIFGVDAAPAALVGAFIVSLGIEAGSNEAVSFIPLVTLFVGLWLLIMAAFKAGRVVTYISTPVMGGFISGISTTIIFMQIPKLLGGKSGAGELPELLVHIYETCRDSFNGVSLLLGVVSLAILLISKKVCPKIPMAIAVMAAGAVIGGMGFAKSHGVATLEAVKKGLPSWHFPKLCFDNFSALLTTSLTIAVVIMAETLLASKNVANRNGYKLNENREILVYSLGNLAACFTGCCPVNGSVSRTSMGEQYGGRSQVMSLTASVTMAAILMFGTGFIQYLPVPVLTAIVISALLGAVEFDLMKRLYAQDRRELLIFLGAFFGVLLLGTVMGVVIGVILSFVSIIIRTANPKRSFLGVIPGHEGFHSLDRNTYAVPLKNAVIYRFSGNLYFANIHIFTGDIESAIKPDTQCVVVDSGAICSIDITAAERIESLKKSLDRSGVKLYFASHIGTLNDRFRALGLGELVERGHCRRTIPSALENAGFRPPYILEESEFKEQQSFEFGNQHRLEFEWAFGSAAEDEIEKYALRVLSEITESNSDPEQKLHDILKLKGQWKGISDLDQEELLNHLETHIRELSEKLGISPAEIEERIEMRKMRLAKRISENNPTALEAFREHSFYYEKRIKERDPELYKSFMAYRAEALAHLRESFPEYAEIIEKFYAE